MALRWRQQAWHPDCLLVADRLPCFDCRSRNQHIFGIDPVRLAAIEAKTSPCQMSAVIRIQSNESSVIGGNSNSEGLVQFKSRSGVHPIGE
jgi:hypothetical protein